MARHVRLMHPEDALYDLTCHDCRDPRDNMRELSLSSDGNNLTRSATLAAIRRHRKKFPTHAMSYTALASIPVVTA